MVEGGHASRSASHVGRPDQVTASSRAVVTPRVRLTLRLCLVVLSLLPSMLMAKAYLTTFSHSDTGPGPFADALTYLAAGERLNVGHDLYTFGPGDRPLFVYPPSSTAALLSPPPIAAPWRLLALSPAGITLWIASGWLCLLGTMAYLVFRLGWPAAIVCALFFRPVGEQLAVVNMTAFFPALLVASWRFRAHPQIGLAIGSMAILKLAPATMFGWLAGSRPRALVWAAGAMTTFLVLGAIAAGPGAYVEYLGVATSPVSSPFSLAIQTGLPWLSMAILVGGLIASFLIRHEGLAFAVAIVASVAGNPALYGASLVPLLALLAPFLDGRSGTGDRTMRQFGTRRGLPSSDASQNVTAHVSKQEVV